MCATNGARCRGTNRSTQAWISRVSGAALRAWALMLLPPCIAHWCGHRVSCALAGVETEEDTWWSDVREPPQDVVRRGNRLMEKVMALPDRNVMLVTHSSLLLHTLNAGGVDPELVATGVSAVLPHADMRPKFANAELRSAVLMVQQ